VRIRLGGFFICAKEKEKTMTSSLAVVMKEEEGCATFAQVSNGSTALMIRDRETVDATALAVYLRTVIGQFRISQPLAIELCRRFENLPRKRQVNGTYLEIDGARSLNAWLEAHEKQIGSKRNFYYVRDGGKRKPAPQLTDGADEPETEEKEDTPSTSDIFTPRIAAAKKKLAELQHERDNPFKDVKEGEAVDFKALTERTDPHPTIRAVIALVLAQIAPKGCVISQADNGKWYTEKETDFITVTPEEQKAKRSAAAKKAAATRAANKAAQQTPANKQRRKRPQIGAEGECEGGGCCAPATEVLNGQNLCDKCWSAAAGFEAKGESQ
jgi:hypothetical protein